MLREDTRLDCGERSFQRRHGLTWWNDGSGRLGWFRSSGRLEGCFSLRLKTSEFGNSEWRTADPSASPDFLSRVAASVNCMWFSLGRTTQVATVRAVKQEIRVRSGCTNDE